jgi:hypothetical protein
VAAIRQTVVLLNPVNDHISDIDKAFLCSRKGFKIPKALVSDFNDSIFYLFLPLFRITIPDRFNYHIIKKYFKRMSLKIG